MALLDDSMFNPQTYQSRGILDMLPLLTLPQGAGPLQTGAQFPPVSAQPAQPALPQNAQPAQYQPPPLSMAPQPQQQQPEVPQQSFLESMGLGPNALMALGAGIAGGNSLGDSVSKGVGGLVAARQQNQTEAALVKRGLDPQMARMVASNPAMMKAVIPSLFGTRAGTVINNRLVDSTTGRLIADFSDTKAPDTKEFETSTGGKVAKQWNPATKSWENVPGVQGGGGGKPPAGYQWIDPGDTSKGMQAIAGGPATHLPSETAGRIAMMETAASELGGARKILMDGRGDTGTGLTGAAASAINIGETGRANRTVRLAIEGALRAMTGAAAPETEVSRYENLFLPSPFDSAKTAKQKLDQLDNFIENASRLVKQGRGPTPNAVQPKAAVNPADPLGIR